MPTFRIKPDAPTPPPSDQRSMFRIKSDTGAFRIQAQNDPVPDRAPPRSLNPLIVLARPEAPTDRRQRNFIWRAEGVVEPEAASTGLLAALTAPIRSAVERLTIRGNPTTYAVQVAENAVFDQMHEFDDQELQARFQAQLLLSAWVVNFNDDIKRAVNATHLAGSVDQLVIDTTRDIIADINRSGDRSALETLLTAPHQIERRIRERLGESGLQTDKVRLRPIPFNDKSRIIVEPVSRIACRTLRSDAIANVGYRIVLEVDPHHRKLWYCCRLPEEGGSNSILGEVRNFVAAFLDARYPISRFSSGLGQISHELSNSLNNAVAPKLGLRVATIDLSTDSRAVADLIFEFRESYPILGTSRVMVLEHRGTIRLIDEAKHHQRGAPDMAPLVEEWLKVEVRKYLQRKSLADVVQTFCENEEEGEDELSAALKENINKIASQYGYSVDPVLVVAQNIPERELVLGKDISVPIKSYPLNKPNLLTELSIIARVKLIDPKQVRLLRPYLREDTNLNEVLTNAISEFVGRQLQTNVSPDEFYKSDIANDGGDMYLRNQWIAGLTQVLSSTFGLKVENLEFGRGHDPIRERFAQLLNVNETLKFDRPLVTAAGQSRTIRVIVLYQIQGASHQWWDRFQNKALIAKTEREQLNEVAHRIELLLEFAFQGRRHYESWIPRNLSKVDRKALRDIIKNTVASEYGLDIEIPPDGLFTIEMDQGVDPILQRLLQARDEVALERVRLIQDSKPGGMADLEEDLGHNDGQLSKLEQEIDKYQKKFVENQLKGSPFEQQLLEHNPEFRQEPPPRPESLPPTP